MNEDRPLYRFDLETSRAEQRAVLHEVLRPLLEVDPGRINFWLLKLILSLHHQDGPQLERAWAATREAPAELGGAALEQLVQQLRDSRSSGMGLEHLSYLRRLRYIPTLRGLRLMVRPKL